MKKKDFQMFNGDDLLQVDNWIADYANLKISRKQLYEKLSWELYDMNEKSINKAEKYRSYNLQKRNLEVLYITGLSGSGKTTYAKYLASLKHFDYFVSGSGEDFLDGYDKEECIILDDFRGGTMKFSELLKMLDNNTNSSVRSRYYNKDISNCKLMIITSIFQPNELYGFMSKNDDEDDDKEKMKEPCEQLYRRLKHHFLKIEDDIIREYEVRDTTIRYKEVIWGKISTIFKELGIDKDKVDDTSMFDSLREKDPEEYPF